jgi:hypothetical protein
VHEAPAALKAVPRWTWSPKKNPQSADVWSTPAVARMHDGNCDGLVDELDSPSVVFVSGNAQGVCCSCPAAPASKCRGGTLRLVDGKTGDEVWSLERASPGSVGFAGLSVAVGDVDGDRALDVVAVTGEGHVAVISSEGAVKSVSAEPIPGAGANAAFGWGGGLALGDMNGDGNVEIAYASTVFSMEKGVPVRRFTGAPGLGGSALHTALSVFVDLDGAADQDLELLAGKSAYFADGGTLWSLATALPDGGATDGFSAVADFDGDGAPEVVLVEAGRVRVRDGATGAKWSSALTLSGDGIGGPPTVADFDGDRHPEIGVAQKDFYFVLKPDLATKELKVLWRVPNHDLSSSVTGSTVFDFEGDGQAEVIYGDECFLWVFDGKTGAMRFATPHTSFTATEASVVADVDGDGRAEMVMVSNGADPSAAGWKCDVAPWNAADPLTGRPAWKAPPGKSAYRGITVFGDAANSWVGTRTIWNQHTYHVNNICDARDSACAAGAPYGSIPRRELKNWSQAWLNNFRQNVQDKGLFNAPDVTLAVTAECTSPMRANVHVRNLGSASLPAGVPVALYLRAGAADQEVWRGLTKEALLPGQVERISVNVASAGMDSVFVAKALHEGNSPYRQCRTDNDESAAVKAICIN